MSLTKATSFMIKGAVVNVVDYGASTSATAAQKLLTYWAVVIHGLPGQLGIR